MKKIALILTALLVFGAGQAMASFDSNTLIMNVYNNTSTTGDLEYGLDTGFDLSTVDWSGTVNYTVETGLSTDLFDLATWSDLQFGLWGRNTTTSYYGQMYFMSSDVNAVGNGTQISSFNTASGAIKRKYDDVDTDNDGVAMFTNNLNQGAYDNAMNQNIAPGRYNGLNGTNPVSNGEANLAALADANGIVTMYLFGYTRAGFIGAGSDIIGSMDIAGDLNHNVLAIVTLDADGTLTISNADADPCPNGDADDDGVCDDADDCPNTPADAEVDENGCAQSQRDSDGDGVFDDADQCPGTPAGTAVDGVGCPLPVDSDGDGVPDSLDQCPGTPDVHSDADGIANCIDTDDDDDGLPDSCDRTEWGLNPIVANATDGDLDNDGFTDSQECQSGFNPNSDTSQPARPTVATDDGNASSGESVTLTATATQGSNPIAAFTWSQTEGPAVSVTQTDTIPTSRITFTAPAVASGQSATLRFAITAADSVGIASSPAAQATVTVASTGNNPPSEPGLHAPAIDPVSDCQVESATPQLVVSNATDLEGDDIVIEIQVSGNEAFTDVIAADDIAQATGNTTAWTYAGEALDEDTLYYWHARACDADACSAFMDPIGFFFVNAENAPPVAPVLDLPADGANVGSLRPALSVDLTAYSDGTDRYDTHNYQLMVSSDGSFSQASLVVDQTFNCAAGGEPDTWQVTPTADLTEGATYYWRVAYGDDGGGGFHTAFSAQTAVRTFTVNASTDAPAAPTELNPGGGIDVSALPVTLSFVNNGDPDSPVLDFEVTLSTASGAAFEENIVQTIPILDVDRNQSAVSVQVADLTENHRYYWRVSVTDTDGNASASATADFRLNTDNDPPGTPVAIQPADDAVWSTYAPTFIVQVQGDSEGDPIYCLFEVFEEDGDLITASQRTAGSTSDDASDTYTCAWRLNSTDLSNDTTYRWVATAFDGTGEAAAYAAAAFHFTTGVNFYQPTAPTLNNPYSGGTVRDLKPALSVFRSMDDDGDNLSYQFELYPCANLSCRTIALAEPVERVQTVEAVPVSPLAEDQTYYWRVRAMDREDSNEGHASAWMPTASFSVNSDGPAASFDAQIDLSRIAAYDAEETQIFTVTASGEQDMVGVQVAIPAGAIPAAGGDINLQIGHATRAPALPIGKDAVGPVVFLAPEGFQFDQAVTVRIPVVPPGDDDPEGLLVLTYDAETREWTEVDGDLEENGMTMAFRVRHFSLYTLALDDPITPGGDDDPSGGGGGGGGCFIGSLAE